MTNPRSDFGVPLRPGSLLAELSNDCLMRLKTDGLERSVSKGQTIFQKGDDGTFLAIILEGRIKISTFSAQGRETVLNILQSGDVIGEIAALDGDVRTSDAIAIDNARLFQIPSQAILHLIEEVPDFAVSMTRALCKKLRSTSAAVESGTLDMARRAAAALVRLARQNDHDDTSDDAVFQLAIDQTTLAQYAGLARSNINRSLKKFEHSGAARHQNGTLFIHNLEWLEDFADSDDF